MKGRVFDIKKFAIHDGPGIRTTVFLTGCPLSCWWCHNPESIRQYAFDNAFPDPLNTISSACLTKDQTFVKKMTIDELMFEIEKDRIFYEESGGGVTFSGGEPTLQFEYLKEALKECRKKDIHTVVDTSGYTSYANFLSINDYVNLYLYDLKIIDEEDHKKYTGVSNKLIIDNMKNLIRDGKQLEIRIPLIPEVTDSEKNLDQLAELIKPYISSVTVDFLPYNKFAESKYTRFNETPKLGKLETQSEEELNKIKTDFEKRGYKVSLRG